MGCVQEQHAPTVGAILDRYEQEVVPFTLSPATQAGYRRIIPKLRALWGDRLVSELKPKDFGPWIYEVRRGRVQRCRMLAVLSAALTCAVSRWYLIDRNVLRDVERPKNPPRDRLVSRKEFETFRFMNRPFVQLMMDLAVRTGQRQGDLLDLKWSQIKGMEIHFQQSKTGKRIVLEITPELEAVLDRCYLLPGRGEYVISRSMGGRYTGAGFRAEWQRKMDRYCRLGNERFTFHDLRAMAATSCKTPEEAMRLLGHTTMAMTLRVYRRGAEHVKPIQLGA